MNAVAHPKKRPNGQGSLYPRQDRRGQTISYRAVVTVGWKAGQQVRRCFSAPTRNRALQWLHHTLAARDQGWVYGSGSFTLAHWLELWLQHKASEIRETTLESYRQVLETQVKSVLGSQRLDRLKPAHIDHLHQTLQAKGLSHRTLEYAHVLVQAALDYAVRLEAIPRNVAKLVPVPRRQTYPEVQVWTPQEASRFLQYLKQQQQSYYPLFHLALATGMRRGELLGLKWDQVRFEPASLKVRTTLVEIKGRKHFSAPKTQASQREIALSPETLEVLRAH